MRQSRPASAAQTHLPGASPVRPVRPLLPVLALTPVPRRPPVPPTTKRLDRLSIAASELQRSRDARAAAAAPARVRRRGDDAPPPPPRDEIDGFEPHVPGIDYGLLDNLLGYAVRRAQIVLYEDLYRTFAPWQMTPRRYSTLTVIANNPGLKLTQLARVIGVAPSGMVSVLRGLESLGYLSRTESTRDARAYALEVTPAGRRALARIDEALIEHERRIAGKLTEAERSQLMALLARLAVPPA